nr:ethanolamine ammonia-lyase subunit EutC [uncultured Massilia sp.]
MDDTPAAAVSPPASPWEALRRFTPARIALGHAGISQRTASQLAFQLAHARARDAVHVALDAEAVRDALAAAWPGPPPLLLHSAAASRDVYLQRPDLGRRLDDASRAALASARSVDGGFVLGIVVVDGLSAPAIAHHAVPFLGALRQRLASERWTCAPAVVVRQGRVAIGDEIGELLGVKMVVVLIGERPGLSSPDSMGLYITWAPRRGLTDERRNCISNIHAAGLSYDEAAAKLHYLMNEARKRGLTGVALKDETGSAGDTATVADGARPLLL